jgi:polar amino acid transport system substrate-binding protein
MRKIIPLIFILVIECLHAEPFTAVYNKTYAPFSFMRNNQLVGLEVDIVNELAKRAGLVIKHRAVPWARAQLMIEEGKADIFVTVSTPERESYAFMSKNGLFSVTNTAVTAKTNPRIELLRMIKTIEDADKFRQVNYRGTGIANALLKNANVNYLPTSDSIFSFLLLNRADIYIESDVNIYYNANRLNIQREIEVLPVKFNSVLFRLGISKKSQLMLRTEEINKVIGTMIADGVISKILKSYGVQSSKLMSNGVTQ